MNHVSPTGVRCFIYLVQCTEVNEVHIKTPARLNPNKLQNQFAPSSKPKYKIVIYG